MISTAPRSRATGQYIEGLRNGLRVGGETVARSTIATPPGRFVARRSFAVVVRTVAARLRSYPLPDGLAEQPGGPEHHEQDQDGEHHRLTPLLTQADTVVETLDEPDDDAAEDRAGEVTDPAEDRRRERDQSELESQVVPGGPNDLLVHEPGGAGQRPAQAERERDDAV